MDLQNIKKFLDSIKDTDIEELLIEKDGEKIGFKRSEIKENQIPQKEEVSGIEITKKDTFPKKVTIKSPMVGTFYRAPTPDAEPYITEGKTVNIGQKVCIIEAMKVHKEITSDVKGKVLKALVENDRPVEYGQELFLVEVEK